MERPRANNFYLPGVVLFQDMHIVYGILNAGYGSLVTFRVERSSCFINVTILVHKDK